MTLLAHILLGVAVAAILIGFAALAERRSCNPPRASWRARSDSETHGAE